MKASCLIVPWTVSSEVGFSWWCLFLNTGKREDGSGPRLKDLYIPMGETGNLESIKRAIESRTFIKIESISLRLGRGIPPSEGHPSSERYDAIIDIPEEFLLTSEFKEAREYALKHWGKE